MSIANYRADVDGLRAIAVLAVLFFHADYVGFSGGFVGVDVFFVISGFLITSLILKDIERGNFSIINFYERRFRRILPALFFVVILTLIFCWFFLLPQDYKKLGKSAIALSYFCSNFYFLDKTGGYFGEAAEMMPLLHTWSLAVEEQFYIVFPVLLALIYRISPKSLGKSILVLTLLSFGLRFWGEGYPDETFFMLPTRGWELMLGALLACSGRVRLTSLRAAKFVRESIGFVGISFIFISVYFYNSKLILNFPISNTFIVQLFASFGTFMVIWSNNSDNMTFVGKILSKKPCVAIGLISYSLYLWHWPVLVFARYVNTEGRLSLMTSTIMLFVSCLLAIITYYFVEQPFRVRLFLPTTKKLYFGAVAQFVIIVVAGLTVVEVSKNKIVPWYFPAEAVHYLDVNEVPLKTVPKKTEKILFDPSPELIRQGKLGTLGMTTKGAPDFLLWGDSHASCLVPLLDDMAKDYGLSGLHATYSANPPLLNAYVYKQKVRSDIRKEVNDEVFNLLINKNIKVVVMAAFWSRYASDVADRNYNLSDNKDEKIELFETKFTETIEILKKNDISIWIVKDAPSYEYHVPSMLAKNAIYADIDNVSQDISNHKKRSDNFNKILKNIDYEKLYILDPAVYLCKNEKCITHFKGESLYLDSNHLSMHGARYIKPIFSNLFNSFSK